MILVDLSDETPPADDPADDLDDSSEDLDIRHGITDRTGKQWDITYAVQNYGFDPDGFQFGLGPDAIKPILDPQIVCEGEDGIRRARHGILAGKCVEKLPLQRNT